MALSTVAQWVYNRIMGTRANADATGNHAIDRLVLLSEIAQQIAAGGGGGGSFDPHSPGVIGDVTPGNATFDTLTVDDEANFSGTPNFNGNDVTFSTPTIAATWRTKLDVPKADTVLLIANNFTDVGDPDDCRTNLDVYSKAEVDALSFDPAVPGDIGGTTPSNGYFVVVRANSGDFVGTGGGTCSFGDGGPDKVLTLAASGHPRPDAGIRATGSLVISRTNAPQDPSTYDTGLHSPAPGEWDFTKGAPLAAGVAGKSEPALARARYFAYVPCTFADLLDPTTCEGTTAYITDGTGAMGTNFDSVIISGGGGYRGTVKSNGTNWLVGG